MMNTDAIFQDVGSCGLFQVCHVILVQLLRVAAAWGLFLSTFILYDPGWSCALDKNISATGDGPACDNATDTMEKLRTVDDSSLNQQKNVSATILSRNCHQNSTKFYFDSTLINEPSRYNSSCRMLDMCDSVQFDPASVTVVTDFELICDRDFIPTIIVFINAAGTLCGSLCAGQIGEMLGRKISIYGNAVCLAVFQLLSSFSVSWTMYAAITFFSGFAIGGILTTNFVYTSEYLNSKWRGILAGIPIWNISVASLACVILLLKNWRHVHIATAVLAGVSSLGFLWVPESFRWLYVHEKSKDIEGVLSKMAKVNRKNVDTLEMTNRVLNEKDIGYIQPENVANNKKKYTYLDLFRTSYIRNLTIKSSLAWFLLQGSYYTLSFGTKDLAGDFYVNLLLSGFTEIPVTILLIPIVNKLGRKWASLVLQATSGLCAVTIVILLQYVQSHRGFTSVTYLAVVAKATNFASWSSLAVHSVEIFPTVVRNLASGFVNASSLLGVMIAPYLVPTGMLVVTYVIVSTAALVTLVVMATLPETNNVPLEEFILTPSSVSTYSRCQNI